MNHDVYIYDEIDRIFIRIEYPLIDTQGEYKRYCLMHAIHKHDKEPLLILKFLGVLHLLQQTVNCEIKEFLRELNYANFIH